jgi:hypothetical protein
VNSDLCYLNATASILQVLTCELLLLANHMVFGQSHAFKKCDIPFFKIKHARTDGTPLQFIIVGSISALSN